MTSTAARPRLSPAAEEFLAERHLATVSTLRANGTPHMVAVGFSWDPEAGIARIITDRSTVKVKNVRRSGYAAVSQVDGARWLTLEGPATILEDADAVAEAEARYTGRYKTPRENPTRVVIAITVTRALVSQRLEIAD
ncbi:TIGR03618 family F420-dependent PPOX class oxidoreductase [Nocardia sp. NPDC088792]|uniref:TIGR03618 family F420-dependent PPOX class oxidoreductase n=1 Tax=Nocardia sp. NPDC088792 TaxID=3364332 RepID=UPI003810866F